MGAVPRMVFEIEAGLKTLARSLGPKHAQAVEEIISQLRDLVAAALTGGSEGQPSENGPF